MFSTGETEWTPSYGDIVWVQTHSSFPFWPACVMDPSMLPVETQAMATAALSRAASFSSITGGRDIRTSKKRALYMFASAHYDFATPQQVINGPSHQNSVLIWMTMTSRHLKLN